VALLIAHLAQAFRFLPHLHTLLLESTLLHLDSQSSSRLAEHSGIIWACQSSSISCLALSLHTSCMEKIAHVAHVTLLFPFLNKLSLSSVSGAESETSWFQ
jgi:hypothetical protein